jgi:hypothetical protein
MSSGPTAITGHSNGHTGMAPGSRNMDTSAEPCLGYGRQFRVYGVARNNTEQARRGGRDGRRVGFNLLIPSDDPVDQYLVTFGRRHTLICQCEFNTE